MTFITLYLQCIHDNLEILDVTLFEFEDGLSF